MSELIQQSIGGNELLVFLVALFFSAIGGQKMEPGQRVALVYSYCLIVAYFNYIDFYAIVAGSLIVLFLIFEVFNSDTMLVRLFSFKYKFFDFLYRIVFEFYGAFFYLVLFVSTTSLVKGSVISQIAFLMLVIALAAVTSRQHFSTKPISEIVKELEKLAGDPASCSFDDKDNRKLQILVYMEDGNFLNRNERTHIVTARYLISKIARRIKRSGLSPIRNGMSKLSSLRRFVRGYGTIEMQIIRNVGLHFGSYRLTVRRKIFELLFAQAVFNSYINQLGKKITGKKEYKDVDFALLSQSCLNQNRQHCLLSNE